MQTFGQRRSRQRSRSPWSQRDCLARARGPLVAASAFAPPAHVTGETQHTHTMVLWLAHGTTSHTAHTQEPKAHIHPRATGVRATKTRPPPRCCCRQHGCGCAAPPPAAVTLWLMQQAGRQGQRQVLSSSQQLLHNNRRHAHHALLLRQR
jgi:hypothetical protein